MITKDTQLNEGGRFVYDSTFLKRVYTLEHDSEYGLWVLAHESGTTWSEPTDNIRDVFGEECYWEDFTMID